MSEAINKAIVNLSEVIASVQKYPDSYEGIIDSACAAELLEWAKGLESLESCRRQALVLASSIGRLKKKISKVKHE